MKNYENRVFISSDNIENLKELLNRSQGERRSIIEFCWGNVVLIEDKNCGRCVLLENISLIEFFYDFKSSLVNNKSEQNAEDLITDMNQSYGLHLSKVKESLIIGTHAQGENCDIVSNYAQALHHVMFASQAFFKDLVYHCPQLEGTGEAKSLRKMLT